MSLSNLKKKLFSKNENYITLLNIIGTLVYQGINFLLTPYLTRALSIEGYGVVSVYTAWMNILVPIVGLSTQAVIPHIKLYIDKKDRDKYTSSLLGLSFAAFAVMFILSVILLPILSGAMQMTPMLIILLLLQSFGVATVNFAVAHCVQYQKTIIQFIITISLALVTSGFSIALIQIISDENYKYIGRVIGYSLPNFLVAILIYILFIKKGKTVINKQAWLFALPICVPIIFHSLSNVLLSQSSRIVLQNIVGFESAGIYSFIYTVASLISVLWVAVNNAWVPIYYDMLGEHENDRILSRAKKYNFFFTSICCGFLLVSPEIMRIMGGASYNVGIPYTPFIVISMYFLFMYSFPVNYKTICKKTLSIAIGTVLSAIINIVASLLLIPQFELLGAAAATLISYVALFLFHQLSIKEEEFKYDFKMKFYIVQLSFLLCCTAIFYLSYNLWYIRWAVAAAVGAALLYKIIKQRAIF